MESWSVAIQSLEEARSGCAAFAAAVRQLTAVVETCSEDGAVAASLLAASGSLCTELDKLRAVVSTLMGRIQQRCPADMGVAGGEAPGTRLVDLVPALAEMGAGAGQRCAQWLAVAHTLDRVPDGEIAEALGDAGEASIGPALASATAAVAALYAALWEIRNRLAQRLAGQ